MTPAELLAKVEGLGVGVTLDRQDLVLRPKSKLTPDLVDQLREHKAELMEMLKTGHKPELVAELSGETLPEEAQWPPECRESERRFGSLHARLYPLLGYRVVTPEGHGELVQVFSERASVRLDVCPDQLTVFLPEEIRPLGADTADSRLPIRRPH